MPSFVSSALEFGPPRVVCSPSQFVEGLKAIRQVIFNNEAAGIYANQPIKQVYMWALVLMMLNHMARACLFSCEKVRPVVLTHAPKPAPGGATG